MFEIGSPIVYNAYADSAKCNSLISAALAVLAAAAAPVPHNTPSKATTLVTLTGQARGGPMVWASLRNHVLKPLAADLALFCEKDCDEYGALRRLARYTWRRQGPTKRVWDEVIARRPGGAAAVNISAHTGGSGLIGWGGLSRAKDGGGTEERDGSGAIIAESNAQLLEHLTRSGALRSYEHFIFSRSDFYYVCDYPPPAGLLTRFGESGPVLVVPIDDGQREKELLTNDRQAVIGRAEVPIYLGVLQNALNKTVETGKLWCGHDNRMVWVCNTQSMLRDHLHTQGVSVRNVKLPGFLVREPTDSRNGRGSVLEYTLNELLVDGDSGPPDTSMAWSKDAATGARDGGKHIRKAGFDAVTRPKVKCCPHTLPPTAKDMQCLIVKLDCYELCPALASLACNPRPDRPERHSRDEPAIG